MSASSQQQLSPQGNPNNQQLRQKLPIPQSELDYHMQLTNTVWGSDLVNPELRDILMRDYVLTDQEGQPLLDEYGNPILKKNSLWAMHAYYTRDMRLGNLDKKNPLEFLSCQYDLDLAGDMLKTEMLEPFMILLSRVATILELSQSRGGFLRKEMNTLRSEQKQELLEPPKKSLFGKQEARS